jgi:hypothetical protein
VQCLGGRPQVSSIKASFLSDVLKTNPLSYSRFRLFIESCGTAIRMDGDAMLNRNAVHDSIVDGPIQVLPQWNCQGWAWNNCSFEFDGALLTGNNFTYWTFTDCWFEGAIKWGTLAGNASIVIRGGPRDPLHAKPPAGVSFAP